LTIFFNFASAKSPKLQKTSSLNPQKESMHRGMVPDSYFWKDHTSHEVDFLYDDGRHLFL
jgi:hypothetical protein